MANDQRITIRFEPDVYNKLNRRRFDLRLTWQTLCRSLLQDWYARTNSDDSALISEQIASPPLQQSECEITSLLSEIDKGGELANQLASVLRSGNERAIAIITGAIEVAAFRVERDDLKSGH